jgi:hypothetical protein
VASNRAAWQGRESCGPRRMHGSMSKFLVAPMPKVTQMEEDRPRWVLKKHEKQDNASSAGRDLDCIPSSLATDKPNISLAQRDGE